MAETRVIVSRELATDLLTVGWALDYPTRCEHGLPPGAELIGAGLTKRRDVYLTFTVAEGECLGHTSPLYVRSTEEPCP